MVRLLMERQELEQRDLITQFGSECSVSMFLFGQRKRTLEQVRTFTMPAQSESELCGCNVRTGPPAPNFPFSSPRSFENALQAVSLSQTAFKSFVAQSLPKASLYPPSKLNIQNPVLSQVAQRSPSLETQTPDSLPQIQLHLSFRPLQLFKVRRELTIALPGVFSHATCKLISAQVLRQTSLQLHGCVNVVGTFFALQITAKQNDSFNRTQEIIAGVYFLRALQESLECLVSRRSNNGLRRGAPPQTTSLVC